MAYPAGVKFCTRDGARLVESTAAAGNATAPPAQDIIDLAEGMLPRGHGPGVQGLTSGQTLDGRYRIERKVGEGGMALVYLALDVTSGEQVAIKVLSPALAKDANAMARLRREAGLAGRLAHPNVCHIIRLGEPADAPPYVVMPFLDGQLLSEREHRLGHLPLDETVRFARDIAAGLHVAHQLGIIHRDLKPENVMIVRDDVGAERAVVMDFGLAKERRAGKELQKLTATGIIMGTPEFMSPEQLRGKPLDGRTDVYALALVTYEMLTGKLPFGGKTQQEMMIARLRNAPTPLRKMRPELGLPAAVEAVVARGMDRDPDARYASAPEFADALERAARGEELPPPPRKSMIGRLFGSG
jgi:serine/threonine-protein kinase